MSIERELCRRGFFGRVATGLQGAAIASLLAADARRAQGAEKPARDVLPRVPPLPARATSVIHLFMNGGPSQMDLFDPKPELEKHHGEPYVQKIAGEVENIRSAGALLRSPFRFARHGKCGAWFSEVLPHIASHADDIALVRSLHTTSLTHEPAVYLIQSGKTGPGRPCLGSWVVYGLGTVNQDLPAYVVLDDPLGLPINGVENWQSGFLPPLFQGTRFRATGTPVLNLRPERNLPLDVDRVEREFRSRLDRRHLLERPLESALEARVASYELAARMQLEASDALDLTRETQQTRDLYGIGREPTDSYGRRCLIARRLVERGVRFVQLYINQQIWDNHADLAGGLRGACQRTDEPIAGLLVDLKQRGLLASTLVVWGGEFGRLPIAQLPADRDERKAGRDHNKNAACTWFAGAGIRGGTVHGATDDLGFAAVEGKVSVPDWHATILHLLGMHHETLYIESHGLKEKLTGVNEARVVREILA
ncbi:MAG TPA: DUF1501 domain-containing protein [Planctomycetota bacterium]|jgi:hypothetical protein|nr:DUF1501 domain-containing protein [Planctomycetota bacterium]